MKEIRLTNGMIAQVDDADYERLLPFKWSSDKRATTVYAYRKDGKVSVRMHKEILGAEKIDHIDGNGLNNCRSNLRPCNSTQNGRNRKINRGVKSSKFKGVSFNKEKGKYCASIKFEGKNIRLGYHRSEERAAFQYDTMALLLFGEFAATNGSLLGCTYRIKELIDVPRKPNNNYSYDFEALSKQ